MLGMGRKKNNNNTLKMSLIGLGVGAAAYSMMKGRNGGGNIMEPIQKAFNQQQRH